MSLVLLCATGLMLSTAFSGVYGMEIIEPEIKASSSERKQKASPTGLFTQSELEEYKQILTAQFRTVYAAQEDNNMHAYLFAPNPELTPYAERISARLNELADHSKYSHNFFFADFNAHIAASDVSGIMLLFAIERFQAVRDENKPRNPEHLREEADFIKHTPNPAGAFYLALTRPVYISEDRDLDWYNFYKLDDAIAALKEGLAKPAKLFLSTFGSYSFNTTEHMTTEVCKRLEKSLFTAIPPLVPVPIIGKGYVIMPCMLENLINDCFPVAFPFSSLEQYLSAHGLCFSDTTFSLHDFLHMLSSPRNQILYHYAESLLQKLLVEGASETDAMPRVVARVAKEYDDFKIILNRFISSDVAKGNERASAGLFWILHKKSFALSAIFPSDGSMQSIQERFRNLVEKEKTEIDNNLNSFDMSSALFDITMESQEEQNRREGEISLTQEIKSIYKIPVEAQLATIDDSNRIRDLLLANDKKGDRFKQHLLKYLASKPQNGKILTYVTRSKQFLDITIIINGVPYIDPVNQEIVPDIFTNSLHPYPPIQNHYAILIEAQHNLKALPKALQQSIRDSFPTVFREASTEGTSTEEASVEEQRAFICTVNDALKENVDAFGTAMGAFLTSAEPA